MLKVLFICSGNTLELGGMSVTVQNQGKSLEKQGFVIQKLGKPVKYLAVKPEIVIEKFTKLYYALGITSE